MNKQHKKLQWMKNKLMVTFFPNRKSFLYVIKNIIIEQKDFPTNEKNIKTHYRTVFASSLPF